MDIISIIQSNTVKALKALYALDISESDVLVTPTRKEFDGDYTIVVFSLTKATRKAPDQLANEIGTYLIENGKSFTDFNTIKGFLNLSLNPSLWLDLLKGIAKNDQFGQAPSNGKKVLIEFSSPNTNKPLHLGHIRNILLGWSTSMIFEEAGYEVLKTQVINDRGIAICKSMLAWQKFGEGKTPESTGIKSDHFVGEYYVLFESAFRKEYQSWQETDEAEEVYSKGKGDDTARDDFFKGFKNRYFNEYSKLGIEAREMLHRWEDGDKDTLDLWKKMNGWVYLGFDETYEKLGVHFDVIYHESDTYKLGKSLIEDGLKHDIFYKKEDGSVWIDLEEEGMDQKLVLRSDGTSVYMTQDLGTAHTRFEKHGTEKMVYVVADEQNYHFKALFAILKKIGEPYADGLHHLSYGMVDLPSGKMKSREGTVVDADDLIEEVIQEAKQVAQERGELENVTDDEQNEIFRKIGLAALKFFIVKVNPKKRMTFDPKESVDMQGQTGPYIQNAYVRIQSILRKFDSKVYHFDSYQELEEMEKSLLIQLEAYPKMVLEAADQYDPSLVANYTYALAKSFHKFYHDVRIIQAETESAKYFRLTLASQVARILERCMSLLGIEMPEKM
jgi:arginyl-tRNA synthetase